MLLAGVLLKLGGYGIIRGLYFFSLVAFRMKSFFISLSILGSIFTSMVCLRQVDMKRLVAYSSIVHMGPIFLRFVTIKYLSFLGGLLMLFSHGLCSSGIFYLLNECYTRFRRRRIMVLRGGVSIRSFFTF